MNPKGEKMFEDLFSGFGGKSDFASDGAKLLRENQDLKKRLEATEAALKTSRDSKAWYQENYNKAKIAYAKEVERRRAAEAQLEPEALALDELVNDYSRACAEHVLVQLTPFVAFSIWRKL